MRLAEFQQPDYVPDLKKEFSMMVFVVIVVGGFESHYPLILSLEIAGGVS